MNIQTSLTVLGAIVILVGLLFLLQVRGVIQLGFNNGMQSDRPGDVETEEGSDTEYGLLSDVKTIVLNPSQPDLPGTAVATFTDTTDGLRVEVLMETVDNPSQDVNIRVGTCDAPGEVRYPLNSISFGESVTFLENMVVTDLYFGEYIVTIDGDLGSASYCSTII